MCPPSRTLVGMLAFCLFFFCSVAAAAQVEPDLLHRAQRLAWQKEFVAAENLYREALRRSPEFRDALFGLAQVFLWEGRYREARRLFSQLARRSSADVEAAEGAATAAYWQGDYRTAAREFGAIAARHPERRIARKSLSEIESAARGDVRVLMEGIDDDQPYRAWRSSVTVSSFSDPLTRWDVTAGGYRLNNLDRRIVRTEPFVIATNTLVLPWQRLTIVASAVALRYPDGKTGSIGGLTLSRKLSSNSSLTISADHRELLTNATAI